MKEQKTREGLAKEIKESVKAETISNSQAEILQELLDKNKIGKAVEILESMKNIAGFKSFKGDLGAEAHCG